MDKDKLEIRSPKKMIDSPDPLVAGAAGAGALFVALAATLGGWVGYSSLKVPHELNLPPAIDAERHTFIGARSRLISYYQDTAVKDGRPLVLIHSINAAGSAYEMRPLFERYRKERPVYALDLPGFGFSDRSKRAYSPALYTEAILDFLATQLPSNTPADVIALSLSGEFAARAALQKPEAFHSLTLISPTGFIDRQKTRGSQRANQNGSSNRLYRGLSFPAWSQALYDLIATPASIRYFLKGSFVGQPDPGLLRYSYFTSHQPGAKHAPLTFISGKLFSRDIFETVYRQLSIPVQVIYDKDAFTRFDRLPELQGRPNWTLSRITPTRGLPQFEALDDTAHALDTFWSNVDKAPKAALLADSVSTI